MREMIKKIIMELLPELAGGLHLDRYARVLAAGDSPTEGATSERFRPRYAVDLEILGPDMEPDASFPRYSAVPLPVSSCCTLALCRSFLRLLQKRFLRYVIWEA